MYIFDFVFEEPKTHEAVLAQILQAGCFQYGGDDEERSTKSVSVLYAPPIGKGPGAFENVNVKARPDYLSPRGKPVLLIFVSRNDGQSTGRWACTRLNKPPAEIPGQDLCRYLDVIFDFAEEADCRVYDRQLQVFLTRDNWELSLANCST